MRRRLLALLIVCVTMLTQIGAPMAGVASTGNGAVAVGVGCKVHALLAKRWTHVRDEQTAAARLTGNPELPSEDLPDSHSNPASCAFCAASVEATPVGWVAPEPRVVEIYEKLSYEHASDPVPAISQNRGAPTRGPPAFI